MKRNGRPPSLSPAQDAKLAILYPELRNECIAEQMGLTAKQVEHAARRLRLLKSPEYRASAHRSRMGRPVGFKPKRAVPAIPSTYAIHPQADPKPMRYPLIERCPQRNTLAGINSIFSLAQRFSA